MAAKNLSKSPTSRNTLASVSARLALGIVVSGSLTIGGWSSTPPPRRAIVIPVVDSRDVRFNHLSIAGGLSQSRVQQITQDDQGFIWLGTQYGLDRYDGYSYQVFTHDERDPDSLSCVYTRALFKDRDGYLWVGCDRVLDRFDPTTEKFAHFHLSNADPKALDSSVSHIYQDSAHTLWFATSSGLYSKPHDSGKIERYVHDANDPASISSDNVQVTFEDREGRFWVGGREGLDEFNRNSGRVVRHVAISSTSADLQIEQDRLGHFWIIYGTSGEVGQIDMENGSLTRFLPDPKIAGDALSRIVYTMMRDRDGNMWFGTAANGILRYDESKRTFVRYENRSGDSESLAANRVTTLFQDHDGNIWVGLHAVEPDFFSLREPAFQSFRHKSGKEGSLTSNLVTSIYKDRAGDLWIGTTGALQRVDGRTGQFTEVARPFRGTDVLATLQDKEGSYWFATTNIGLVRLDRKTGAVRIFTHDPANPSTIISNLVERLLIDHNGTLWAATWDGLSRFDSTTQSFTSYIASPGQGNENYYAIAEDVEGMIWLGSNVGLEKFDPITKQFKLFRHVPGKLDGLSESRVNGIYFDKSGRGWIGTQNGLGLLDRKSGHFTNYFDRDGLSGNVVSCIQDDANGHLWMSTNNGISEMDLRTLRFSTYSHEDGLPGDDLTGWGACSQSSDGEMYFGGFSGATAFYPRDIQERPYLPEVRLTEFRVDGNAVVPGPYSPLKEALNHTNSVTLEHRQSIFSISFAALGYSNAATTRYRYKLDGLDNNWHEVDSKQRTASYTTLPAGTYTFHVESATIRGQWSSPGATLRVEILPAWWDQWWFRTCYITTALLAFFGFYRYRLHQLAEGFKGRMEERVMERTRIAQELHDTLLQSMQGTILHFQSVDEMLPAHPLEAKQILQRSLQKADLALVEGRDAIMDIRASSTTAFDLAQILRSIIAELHEEAGFDRNRSDLCLVVVQGVPRIVRQEKRDDICRIAREALLNAMQHAKAQRIIAEITHGVAALQIQIADDGKGMELHVLNHGGRPGHWGLVGMRERAARMGATLEIFSGPEGGTRILLTLPASLAYESHRSRSRWWVPFSH